MKNKKYLIIYMIILSSSLCNCNDSSDCNFILNHDGSDIIINGSQINITLRINDDLYVLKSNDTINWQSDLIQSNIGLFPSQNLFNIYHNIIKLCFMNTKSKRIYYYSDLKKTNIYSTVGEYNDDWYKHNYSFSLDRDGMLHFLFQANYENILLKIQINNTWEYRKFFIDDGIINIVGIKIDPFEVDHFFLITDSWPEKLLYIYGSGEKWKYELIGQYVTYADFSIDDHGIIYLIMQELRENDLTYRTHYLMKTVGGWVEAEFADELRKLNTFRCQNGFIAKDEGILHILASNLDSLYYLSNKNGSWKKTEIAQSYSDSFGSFSFTVDEENNAHIAYCDSEDDEDPAATKLYYVTDKTGEWVRHKVDFTP